MMGVKIYDDEMKGVEVAAATVEQIEIGDLVVEESASKLKDLVPYNGIVNVEGLYRPLLAVQTSSPAPPLRVKIFKFSESAIDLISLIKATANSSPNPKPFSTFQSLSTHVWRAVTRARNLEPGDATVPWSLELRRVTIKEPGGVRCRDDQEGNRDARCEGHRGMEHRVGEQGIGVEGRGENCVVVGSYNGVVNVEGLHRSLLAVQVPQPIYESVLHFYIFNVYINVSTNISDCIFSRVILIKFDVIFYEAERWTSNGVRIQPRDPRRDFHVALHDLMGPDLNGAQTIAVPPFLDRTKARTLP
ncbi:hypothetical protein C3L33_03245, partial [Rhododendron williamsianum]